MDPSLGGVPGGPSGHHPHHPHHPGVGGPGGPGDASLQGQLNELARTQVAMQQHMTNLSQDYQAVIGEMMNFQRNMVAQDQLMQNLIQYLVSLEAGASLLPFSSSSSSWTSSRARALTHLSSLA